jgi:hypothetical protein
VAALAAGRAGDSLAARVVFGFKAGSTRAVDASWVTGAGAACVAVFAVFAVA